MNEFLHPFDKSGHIRFSLFKAVAEVMIKAGCNPTYELIEYKVTHLYNQLPQVYSEMQRELKSMKDKGGKRIQTFEMVN